MGAAAGPNIVEDGLVLCLDAANERSYPGSGDTWYDLSGNGNDFLHRSKEYQSDSFYYDGTGTNDWAAEKNSNKIIFGISYTVNIFASLNVFGNPNSNCAVKPGYLFGKEFALESRYRGDTFGITSSGNIVATVYDISFNRVNASSSISSLVNLGEVNMYTMVVFISDSTGKAKISIFLDGYLLDESAFTGDTYAIPQGG